MTEREHNMGPHMQLTKPIKFWFNVLLGCALYSPSVAAQNGDAPSPISETRKQIDPEGRVLLWGNIAHGMTKAEAKALHPDKSLRLSENCFANLGFKVDKSKIYEVEVSWSAKNKNRFRCVDVALNSLKEKYGEPETDKLVQDNSVIASLASSLNQLNGQNLGTSGTNVVMKRVLSWSNGSVSITMKIDPDQEFSWYISYQKKETISAPL